MRITQEADYAIRICLSLDKAGGKIGAQNISKLACTTPQITLKILRKLTQAGYVRSYKGVSGGYELCRDGGSISVLEIIEVIDGPLTISKCLCDDYGCTKNECKEKCKMHIAFELVNRKIIENLGNISLHTINDDTLGAADIAEIINKK